MSRDQRGNASALIVAIVVILGACCIGIGRVGAAVVVQARAENAADAAALAAADALALGATPSGAEAAAHKWARANDATLVRCDCRGSAAEVEVEVAPVGGLSKPGRARARAEVDFSRVMTR